MYNRRGAEEPFLASIRLLSHRSVQTDDGGHRDDSTAVLSDLLADDASDFRVIVFGV